MASNDTRAYGAEIAHRYRERKKHNTLRFWPIVLLRTGLIMSAQETFQDKSERNSTCLCQKHENFALKLRAIRHLGMPTSPNVLCTQMSNEEFDERLSTLVASTVKFEEWRRIEIILSKGKSTTRIRQVHDEVPTQQVSKLFKEEMTLFREHVSKISESAS